MARELAPFAFLAGLFAVLAFSDAGIVACRGRGDGLSREPADSDSCATAMVAGVQIVFASFIMSVLGLNTTRRHTPSTKIKGDA